MGRARDSRWTAGYYCACLPRERALAGMGCGTCHRSLLGIDIDADSLAHRRFVKLRNQPVGADGCCIHRRGRVAAATNTSWTRLASHRNLCSYGAIDRANSLGISADARLNWPAQKQPRLHKKWPRIALSCAKPGKYCTHVSYYAASTYNPICGVAKNSC